MHHQGLSSLTHLLAFVAFACFIGTARAECNFYGAAITKGEHIVAYTDLSAMLTAGPIIDDRELWNAGRLIPVPSGLHVDLEWFYLDIGKYYCRVRATEGALNGRTLFIEEGYIARDPAFWGTPTPKLHSRKHGKATPLPRD